MRRNVSVLTEIKKTDDPNKENCTGNSSHEGHSLKETSFSSVQEHVLVGENEKVNVTSMKIDELLEEDKLRFCILFLNIIRIKM